VADHEVGEDAARPLYVQRNQVYVAASPVGIGAGAGLAAVTSLAVPIVVAGAGMVALAAWLAIAMPETGFTRPTRETG
jgi:hypothetical protein